MARILISAGEASGDIHAAAVTRELKNIAPDLSLIHISRAAFAALLELFRAREDVERVISPLAFVAASAKIGKNVAIQPFAVIEEDAEIGDDSVIYPHVYVRCV